MNSILVLWVNDVNKRHQVVIKRWRSFFPSTFIQIHSSERFATCFAHASPRSPKSYLCPGPHSLNKVTSDLHRWTPGEWALVDEAHGDESRSNVHPGSARSHTSVSCSDSSDIPSQLRLSLFSFAYLREATVFAGLLSVCVQSVGNIHAIQVETGHAPRGGREGAHGGI